MIVDGIVTQFLATSALEWIAVLLAVAYLLLAIRQSIWCWPCAFVSTGIFVVLFHDSMLYMESALNVFYLVVAIYGFYYWLRGGGDDEGDRPRAPEVCQLSVRTHAMAIVVIAVLVPLSTFLLDRYTTQALPLPDSLTTWTAVWATWLTARKVLENWWYWLVVDAVGVWLFAERGLMLTSALFVLYVLLIPFGYLAWRRDFVAQRLAA